MSSYILTIAELRRLVEGFWMGKELKIDRVLRAINRARRLEGLPQLDKKDFREL